MRRAASEPITAMQQLVLGPVEGEMANAGTCDLGTNPSHKQVTGRAIGCLTTSTNLKPAFMAALCMRPHSPPADISSVVRISWARNTSVPSLDLSTVFTCDNGIDRDTTTMMASKAVSLCLGATAVRPHRPSPVAAPSGPASGMQQRTRNNAPRGCRKLELQPCRAMATRKLGPAWRGLRLAKYGVLGVGHLPDWSR